MSQKMMILAQVAQGDDTTEYPHSWDIPWSSFYSLAS